MNKITLSILAVLAVLSFQNCKKSSTTDTSTTAAVQLQATINGTIWTPDTLSATITYNAAAKTKVFSFSGTQAQKQVNCAVTIIGATSANDFNIGTNTVDASGNPSMVLSTQQKNSSGAYVFLPIATPALNDGSVTVSSIDVVNGLITGSFTFSSRKANYDSSGNIVSVTNTTVAGGTFNNMPYKFVSN